MSRISWIAAVGLASLAVALPAAVNAQPGPRGGGMGQGMMMGPGMMSGGGMGFMCNPRNAGMAEWRASRIEGQLKLTEAQKEGLKRLTEASSKAAESLQAACSEGVPAKAAERMGAMEKRIEASLKAIKIVRPAFEAFYNALDDQQKARLDAIGPRRWGWDNWRWR